MTLGGEAGSVQNPLITYATEIGWARLTRAEAEQLRRDESGVLLMETFLAQLATLNPGVINRERGEDVARRIARVQPNIQGNLDVWEHLRGIKKVFVEGEDRERDIRLFNLDDIGANTFHVTGEWSYRPRSDAPAIRFDVAFCINGIPVVLVETKSAHKKDGMSEAMEQIRRYHEEGPENLAVLQLFGITHLHKFLYGVTWNTAFKNVYDWRQEAAGNFEDLVKAFFDRGRILKVISDFIVFSRIDGDLAKFVLRPHQMRASDKIVDRALEGTKKRGLVWHTQGSGKTYTMITAAKLLIQQPRLDNPTVFILIDRTELEAQTSANLEALGFRDVRIAESKEDLAKLLKADWRGLIVSMIHKFEGIEADLCVRDNIFVLVDEAHRSTAGALGTYLMAAVPNATYIGFTGTPIDQTAHGKGTFTIFGRDDANGYLDKYSIAESVADGTTVPLNYKLAPNELLVDRDTLEREFLQAADAEGMPDLETLNKVLERAVTLRNMMKNPDRVDAIARLVAEHYRNNVEPLGYKAFLVSVDREACSLYKDALDKYLPGDYSEVIISPGHNDPSTLRRFHFSETKELEVRKAFRKPDGSPKILIVTEKLLTGFDAPVLYCMYLDKPMRDHVLLQAIARVNRPYEDADAKAKPAGFVVDFVGIFEKLQDALAFDSKDVSGVVTGLATLQEHFGALMARGREEYLSVGKGLRADKKVEAVVEHFRGEDHWAPFTEFVAELENLFEIIAPDAFLRPYLDDYDALMRIYETARAGLYPGVDIDKSFLRKTAQLVGMNTSSSAIDWGGKIHELNATALAQLMKDDTADTSKVVNLVKLLTDLVAKERDGKPYLISIGEKAEKLAEMFRERQISTEDALRLAFDYAHEAVTAEQEQKDTGLDQNAFAVFFYLRGKGLDGAAVATAASAAFAECPVWRTRPDQARTVRLKLHAALSKAGCKPEVSTEYVDDILEALRRVR